MNSYKVPVTAKHHVERILNYLNWDSFFDSVTVNTQLYWSDVSLQWTWEMDSTFFSKNFYPSKKFLYKLQHSMLMNFKCKMTWYLRVRWTSSKPKLTGKYVIILYPWYVRSTTLNTTNLFFTNYILIFWLIYDV